MNIRPLSELLQKKAEIELNEKPSRVKEDIKHIKSWIAKQPHLNVRPGDNLLLSFLRGSKFSLERTKEKIDFFHTYKTLVPELFSSRDPFSPEMQRILDEGYILPLDTPNSKGERIVLVRMASFNPAKTKDVDLMKAAIMLTDILLNEDDNAVIGGIQFYLDMKGATVEHLTLYSPSIVAKIAKVIQHAYPVRLKGLNYVNAPSYFDILYNILKLALTEKLKSRLKVTKDLNLGSDDIPTSLLPKEYGGEAGPVNILIRRWKEKVESYADWFLEDSKYHSIEEKRIGNAHTCEKLFGVEGSFRKLEVD